jgi:hypothetical protein
MSSRYRILDSHDMLEAIYPTFIEKGLKIESSAVTDKSVYSLRLSRQQLKSEIKQGDVVQYGITISTSDVGAGSVRVEPLIYRLGLQERPHHAVVRSVKCISVKIKPRATSMSY